MGWFDIRRNEWPVLTWAAAWFFCVLAAYYAIRPVRETFATQLSSDQQANLFLWTLGVMVLVTPVYGLVVNYLPKRWLVPAVYGFFISNLAGFWFWITGSGTSGQVSNVFFVWISVFNLFVVTLFWGTTVDLFSGEQGKRLFGLIFGAGTLGQFASSWAVERSAAFLGMSGLMWVSMGLLALAVVCSWQLRRLMVSESSLLQASDGENSNTLALAFRGAKAVARSPYLLGITAFIISLSICGTVVYFQMTNIVAERIPDTDDRLRWFAVINKTHAVVTLILQTAVVGWLLRTIGVGLTIAIVPAVLLVGFATVAFSQTLLAVGAFQVALRAASFSLGNPALEVLYTAVKPEQKYQAKALIDTVGKRTGDVIGAQATVLLGTWGWAVASVSMAMMPVALGALVLCLLLGSANKQATATVRDLANKR